MHYSDEKDYLLAVDNKKTTFNLREYEELLGNGINITEYCYLVSNNYLEFDINIFFFLGGSKYELNELWDSGVLWRYFCSKDESLSEHSYIFKNK